MGLRFSTLSSVKDVGRDCWQALWNTDYPFVQYGYLLALEESGCVGDGTGWYPAYLVAWRDEVIVGILLLYEKYDSFGEYVFDWAWADAYQRYGLRYYPKLVTAIPFTPAGGPRLAGADAEVCEGLVNHLLKSIPNTDISGWHGLFPCNMQSKQWLEAGTFQRLGYQYHWFNKEYQCFEDFLGSFTSRKRKDIRKERKQLREQGINFSLLSGDRLSEYDWESFERFYQSTYHRRSGRPGYLNTEFFKRLGRYCSDSLLIVEARHESKVLAAALFLFSSERLYGRYWGARAQVKGLHFETCYYQGMEFAIQHNLKIFEAGAQGEHKLQRGFEPCVTYSNHFLKDPRFSEIVSEHVHYEALGVLSYIKDCRRFLPFKKSSRD